MMMPSVLAYTSVDHCLHLFHLLRQRQFAQQMLTVGFLAPVFVIVVLKVLLGPASCNVVVLRDKEV